MPWPGGPRPGSGFWVATRYRCKCGAKIVMHSHQNRRECGQCGRAYDENFEYIKPA